MMEMTHFVTINFVSITLYISKYLDISKTFIFKESNVSYCNSFHKDRVTSATDIFW